jgi:hypothetical protein
MSLKPLILAIPLLLAGCGILGIGSPSQEQLATRAAAAPYPGLADQSLAIVVWAPMTVLDEYPGAREEISAFVTTQFRSHMPATRLLDPRQVLNYQDNTLNWHNLPPADIGRHFKVNRVLVIHVLDYSTKRPLVVSNLQGRLRAQCQIWDAAEVPVTGPASAPSRPLWTGLVDAVWPSGKSLDPTQIDEAAVRLRTLDAFADVLVRLFYPPRAPDPALRG